jgi:hypothetical protein
MKVLPGALVKGLVDVSHPPVSSTVETQQLILPVLSVVELLPLTCHCSTYNHAFNIASLPHCSLRNTVSISNG